jgi:hypothetical protein
VKKTDKQTRYHSSNKVTFITLCAFVLALFSVNNLFTQNTCATASTGTVNINGGTSCTGYTALLGVPDGANPLGATTPCTITSSNERWIKFTAIAPTATINVIQTSAPAAAARQLAVVVYSGTCGSLTQIGCSNTFTNVSVQTESLTLSGLTYSPATDYYIRVINEQPNTTLNTNVCITSTPVNNEPVGAFPLTVSGTSVCTTSSFNTYFATNTNCSPSILSPSCPSFTAGISQDVWYSVTVPVSGNLAVNTSGQQMGLALYSGTNSPGCGTMSEIICTETGSTFNPLFAGFSLSGLTPGTYYLRVWKKAFAAAGVAFNMCATSVPITPPVNDEPCGATTASLSSTSSCTVSNTTSLLGATVTTPTPSCAGLSTGVQFTDVWTQFTATAATHSIAITGVSTASATATTNRMFIAVYATSASTCASGVAVAGSEILCSSPTGSLIPSGYTVGGLTAGQTYLIRFFNWGAAGYTNTITYCITTPTVANNDECTGAVQVTPDAGSACTNTVSGTLLGATASFQNNGCAVGDDNDDVWYNFTATSTSHSITITTASSGDFYHSVYSGVCGNIGPAIVCADPNSSVLYNLTVGANYFVRIYSTLSAALTGTNAPFVLCINTPTNSVGCFNPPGDNNFCPNPTSLSQSPYTFTGTVGAPPVAGGLYTSDVPGNLGSVFGGSIESNSWYSFIAVTPTHTFNIVPTTACTVQARVLNVTTSGGCCTSFTSMSNFYSSTASGTLTATGLTVGNTYYLMVDGNSTSNCSYSIPTWVLTSILPLEYVSFIGYTEGKTNVLEWITASENNKSKFTLEHSKDGIDFESIITINGKGSNYSGGTYRAYDENPFDDITYYRLKHADNSSIEKYSNIISVNLKNKYDLVSNIHPNPTTNDLYFDYFSKIKNTIAIELVDYSGKSLLNFKQLIEEGQNAIVLPLSDLDRGVYILKVISDKGGYTSHHKIIKN